MRNRNKALLWVLLVFLMGSLFGSSLTYFFVTPPMSARSGRSFDTDRAVRDLSQRLSLEPQQQIELRDIFESSGRRYRDLERSVLHKHHEEFRALHMETREKIREILQGDQVAKFDAFIAERERHRRPPEHRPDKQDKQ